MMTVLTAPDGSKYEKGGLYEFSDNGVDWYFGILVNIDLGLESVYENTGAHWYMIRECQDPLGKITPPPIEPIPGQWYMCKHDGLSRPMLNAGESKWCIFSETEAEVFTDSLEVLYQVGVISQIETVKDNPHVNLIVGSVYWCKCGTCEGAFTWLGNNDWKDSYGDYITDRVRPLYPMMKAED